MRYDKQAYTTKYPFIYRLITTDDYIIGKTTKKDLIDNIIEKLNDNDIKTLKDFNDSNFRTRLAKTSFDLWKQPTKLI